MIKLVVDSSCDLPVEYLKEKGCFVGHFQIIFNNKTYRDGIDLDSEKFYEILTNEKEIPKTSQVSEIEFKDKIMEALDIDNDVIVLPLSSTLSGAYEAAERACKKINNKRVHLIDTKGASIILGGLVKMIIKEIENGENIAEILEFIKKTTKHQEGLFILNNLEYLKKGGRVSSKKAFIGGILNIKPIFRYDGKTGKVSELLKAKGFKQGIKKMVEYISINRHKECPFAIAYSTNKDEAIMLKDILEKILKEKVIIFGKIGSVIGSHTGPGSLFVSF